MTISELKMFLDNSNVEFLLNPSFDIRTLDWFKNVTLPQLIKKDKLSIQLQYPKIKIRTNSTTKTWHIVSNEFIVDEHTFFNVTSNCNCYRVVDKGCCSRWFTDQAIKQYQQTGMLTYIQYLKLTNNISLNIEHFSKDIKDEFNNLFI